MKIVIEINNNNYGSTGNIMKNIAFAAEKNGYIAYTCFKNSRESKKFPNSNQIPIGIWIERVISEKICFFTGLKDCFNIIGTYKFIFKLKHLHPDIIHIHNIHGSFLNIRIFFNYIKKENIPVVWTLHDTWSFTGQCTYFDLVNCEKWKRGCSNCPKLNEYPSSKVDKTNYLWKLKNELTTNLTNLFIITPSKWLAHLANESYLNKHKISVINNGIDLSAFKHVKSNLKYDYNLNNKYVILGVAFDWGYRKGLDTFIKLANDLPNDYQIILVGTNDEVDNRLPSNVISIHKTSNKEELVELYSIADLFVNPTLEENFPTVNIEALACGTPVISYSTGGSSEIFDETCGKSIKKGDYSKLKNEIINICTNKPFTKEACIKRASLYDMNDKFNEYVKLFDSILNN